MLRNRFLALFVLVLIVVVPTPTAAYAAPNQPAEANEAAIARPPANPPGWPYWDQGIQRWVITLASGARMYYYTYAQAVAGYYSWVSARTILVVPAAVTNPYTNGTFDVSRYRRRN